MKTLVILFAIFAAVCLAVEEFEDEIEEDIEEDPTYGRYYPHPHVRLGHHHKGCGTRTVCRTVKGQKCSTSLKTVCRNYCGHAKAHYGGYGTYGAYAPKRHCRHVCHKQPVANCYPTHRSVCHQVAKKCAYY